MWSPGRGLAKEEPHEIEIRIEQRAPRQAKRQPNPAEPAGGKRDQVLAVPHQPGGAEIVPRQVGKRTAFADSSSETSAKNSISTYKLVRRDD